MKRKMEMIPFILIIVILLFSLFASACSSGSTGAVALDGKSLMQERCSVCHTLARIENAHKTRDEWATTVDRMISMGAQLNSQERTILLDYLAATYSK
jgi:hypothetical protein